MGNRPIIPVSKINPLKVNRYLTMYQKKSPCGITEMAEMFALGHFLADYHLIINEWEPMNALTLEKLITLLMVGKYVDQNDKEVAGQYSIGIYHANLNKYLYLQPRLTELGPSDFRHLVYNLFPSKVVGDDFRLQVVYGIPDTDGKYSVAPYAYNPTSPEDISVVIKLLNLSKYEHLDSGSVIVVPSSK